MRVLFTKITHTEGGLALFSVHCFRLYGCTVRRESRFSRHLGRPPRAPSSWCHHHHTRHHRTEDGIGFICCSTATGGRPARDPDAGDLANRDGTLLDASRAAASDFCLVMKDSPGPFLPNSVTSTEFLLSGPFLPNLESSVTLTAAKILS